MLILYYPPFRADDDGELEYQTVVGLQDYLDDLAEFDVETLANGWREARRAHKTERWPTIQVIRDACIAQRVKSHPHSATVAGMGEYAIWETRMEGWLSKKAWLSSWGPKPDEDGTGVPKPILDRAGVVPKPKPQRNSNVTFMAVARLREAMDGHDVPMFPGEAMDATAKRHARDRSIARAEE